ncbi:hypothetical protein [Nocardia farcinica]|uniref:hypothetical protein n=1 Tax=Nocardia farcinica TaxID=37329 RepID=UPI001E42A7ED|nr:hypothetical protein [Nocardia farcinica]UEX21200.1 hypothetical protein LMJ57_19560 [Nocardia farcinica]
MSAQIRDLTTDLRQLLAAATPGPFTVSSDSGVFANLQSLHRLAPGKDGWRERVVSNVRSADAALIAGVLNALPVLLDALDEAEEARARAAELEAQQPPLLLLGKEFEARAAIDRVRKLHQPENRCDNPVHTVPDATCPQCCDYCQCCGEAMPCATIRAIDGEDSRFPTAKAGGFTGGVR